MNGIFADPESPGWVIDRLLQGGWCDDKGALKDEAIEEGLRIISSREIADKEDIHSQIALDVITTLCSRVRPIPSLTPLIQGTYNYLVQAGIITAAGQPGPNFPEKWMEYSEKLVS